MIHENVLKPDFREVIDGLTLMDDVFMRAVMKDIRCAEYVLRIILDDPHLILDGGYPEADMKNLWGRSLIMDFIGWNIRNSTNYNMEVQKRKERASPQFSLYCYSMLSSHTIKEGYHFESAWQKHVIVMIVEGDPTGQNQPVAQLSLHDDKTGVKIDGGIAIIYVDATKVNEDTEVGKLMKDFHQTNAEDMEDSVLKEAVQHYKETEEGMVYMTETLERYFDQYLAPYEKAAMEIGEEKGREKGIVQGQKKEALETVRRMIALGDTDEAILKRADVTEEELKEIRKSMN